MLPQPLPVEVKKKKRFDIAELLQPSSNFNVLCYFCSFVFFILALISMRFLFFIKLWLYALAVGSMTFFGILFFNLALKMEDFQNAS